MVLLFRSSVDSEARWKPQLGRLMPELEVRVWPEIGDPADIDYALVWRPEPGLLASLPNLKLILSLSAHCPIVGSRAIIEHNSLLVRSTHIN
jgi:glyoxylate/hydroxypyruvate reductase